MLCISASILAAEHQTGNDGICAWCAATHELLYASGPAGAYLTTALERGIYNSPEKTHCRAGANTTHYKDMPILQHLKCLALDLAYRLDSSDGRVCGLAAEVCSDLNALDPATPIS